MGTLVAMKYPTTLFLKLADHTYVECGTGGHGWSCWGGKTGGTAFHRGPGSTKRADAIAQPNEKANIKCYLINGVCHQAANRILLPAGITVRGARGYSVSQALYGTYGLPGMWPCKSPFHQYPDVTGDLPECVPPVGIDTQEDEGAEKQDDSYALFLREELEMHHGAESLFSDEQGDAGEAENFSLGLFRHMAAYHLEDEFDGDLENQILGIRLQTERQRVQPNQSFANKEMDAKEFAEAIDSITERFQDRMAESLTSEQYQRLFDLSPDERVTLADPEIVSGMR